MVKTIEKRVETKESRIALDDFCRMFNCTQENLPEQLVSGIEGINTTYRKATLEEFEEYLLHVLGRLANPYILRTRDENLEAFENGWRENLEQIQSGGISAARLKPKYFRPNKFLRYDNKLIVSENLNLEHDLFTMARYLIFSRYISSYDYIYELGCGSCQNLLMLSELFPSKNLYGLDWTTASSEIAKYLAKALNRNIEGIVFDMANPSSKVPLRHGSAVITVHALEQIGTRHENLLSFIIDSRPGIVVHYEPILEFYDEDNVLDQLALVYSQKRNYLSGFYTRLCKLQEMGKVEILEARRPYLGGVIHESSLIIWRPK